MATASAPELDAQYRQAREECALLARERGLLAVDGPDGAEYLQGQLTNDIEALAPGEGCRAELLDRKGHIQADLRVLRLDGERILIDTEADAAPAALRHLSMYSIGREVAVSDATDQWTVLSLLGPGSEAVSGLVGGPLHSNVAATLAGAEVIAASTREGIDLICPVAATPAVREELLRGGAVEVSEEAAEILRIEAGVPRFGAEMSGATMPAEAGIVEETVSFTKGCYIGQETVARLHYRGRPNRHLRGLRFSRAAVPGEELRLGDKAVGSVGSACVSPAFGPIGLAILRREAEPGATLTLGEGGEAVVGELPFGRQPE